MWYFLNGLIVGFVLGFAVCFAWGVAIGIKNRGENEKET